MGKKKSSLMLWNGPAKRQRDAPKTGCPESGMQAQAQALAAMLGAAKPCEDGCSHVPNKGEQMVRYYGFYSPASRGISRGKRKGNHKDELIPSILEPDGSSNEYRKNWARFIRLRWVYPPQVD